MLHLRQDLLELLRAAARQGQPPCTILRSLIAQLGPETDDRPLWVRYFSEAFSFTNGQAYKIFGWQPDGTGALADAALDRFLAARIQETRAAWDKRAAGTVEPAMPAGKTDRHVAERAATLTRLVAGVLCLLTCQVFAQEKPARKDIYGQLLPDQASARLGPARLQHAGHVTAMVFSPDGNWLASAGVDRLVQVWEADTGKCLFKLEGHRGKC